MKFSKKYVRYITRYLLKEKSEDVGGAVILLDLRHDFVPR